MSSPVPYVVLGHSAEHLSLKRPTVPPGCLLVLTEQCGSHGTVPAHLYKALADPENEPLFRDPIGHKAELEAQLQRGLRIYVAGEEYPAISYNLLNTESLDYVAPSGVYAIPTPDFAYDPTKRGIYRHYQPEEDFALAFEGAVIPPKPPRTKKDKALSVTQEDLFATLPGIYYDFLCRAIATEKKALMKMFEGFPEVNTAALRHSYNAWAAANLFVKTRATRRAMRKNERRDVARMGKLVKTVMRRRRASDPRDKDKGRDKERAEELLLQILQTNGIPDLQEKTMRLIAAVKSVNIREKHLGRTPLMFASLAGNVEAVEALVAKGAAINDRDAEGTTPLAFAVSGPTDVKVAQFLLEHGADPREASIDGESPLHLAVQKPTLLPIVRTLVDLGLDPNVVDEDGVSPLHNAATYDVTASIELLLEAGANPNIQNGEGETALMFAIQEGNHRAAALLVPVTDLELRTSGGQSARDIAIDEDMEDVFMTRPSLGGHRRRTVKQRRNRRHR